jgi:bifunctional non-homologous end joining protein LigD
VIAAATRTVQRRKRLEDLVAGRDDALWFSGGIEGDAGEALFRHACAMNLEGIVSKRIDTTYRSGPFHGWEKIKNPAYVRP